MNFSDVLSDVLQLFEECRNCICKQSEDIRNAKFKANEGKILKICKQPTVQKYRSSKVKIKYISIILYYLQMYS